MVYSSNGEQHMEFRVHNSEWTPVDFDGITLMKRPLIKSLEKEDKSSYRSKAGNWYRSAAKKAKETKERDFNAEKEAAYTVIDIETTGLKVTDDDIIEMAALKIAGGVEKDSFVRIIRTEKRLSQDITALTGITQDMLDNQGDDPKKAVKEFLEFIGENKLVCHNLSFDMAFLQKACKKYGYPLITNSAEDTVKTARKILDDVRDYKLATLASYFGLEKQKHRALDDCRLLFQVYEKMQQLLGEDG